MSDLVFLDGILDFLVWLFDLVQYVKGRRFVCIFSNLVGHERCFDARIFRWGK
jgi:hypothetical protein